MGVFSGKYRHFAYFSFKLMTKRKISIIIIYHTEKRLFSLIEYKAKRRRRQQLLNAGVSFP